MPSYKQQTPRAEQAPAPAVDTRSEKVAKVKADASVAASAARAAHIIHSRTGR